MASIMAISYDSRPVQTIANQIKNGNKRDGIDLRPDYQRGYIWGNEFKDKLIYSVIRNYPIGNISLRVRTEANKKGAMQEVVDGQQRLTTIFNFINEEYSIQGDYSRYIIEYIIDYMGEDKDRRVEKLKKKLGNKGKISIKFSQLPEIIQSNIYSYNISITNITNAKEEEIREYFRFLQNQEILRAGEIINSIPSTVLEKYLDQIKNKDNFLKKIGFNDERKQFSRLFYSILGLFNGSINFGVVDKDVLNFVSECEELDDNTIEQSRLIINSIESIALNDSIQVNFMKSNARSMKFLLLLSGLSLVDFTTDTSKKLSALNSINNKLSAFSSAKADAVSTAFHGYSQPVIEELRLIALISKGGHSYKRVINRMEMLAYYINTASHKMNPSGVIPI